MSNGDTGAGGPHVPRAQVELRTNDAALATKAASKAELDKAITVRAAPDPTPARHALTFQFNNLNVYY